MNYRIRAALDLMVDSHKGLILAHGYYGSRQPLVGSPDYVPPAVTKTAAQNARSNNLKKEKRKMYMPKGGRGLPSPFMTKR